MHAWGLLMVGLIMSSHISSGFAGRTHALHQEQIHQRQQQQRTNDVASYRNLQQLQVVNFSVSVPLVLYHAGESDAST